MKWIELLVAILSGLVICIPLVAKLVQIVRESVKEKNWGALLKLVMEYMCEAEENFISGDTKKAYVMAHLEAMAKTTNYELNDESRQKVSDMIDAMCAMAHVVNGGES